jgi:hypothetical protein
MGKLHTLLAVEADKEGLSRRIQSETTTVFKNKHNHFQATHKWTEMMDENAVGDPEQHLEMVETVASKLDYLAQQVSGYLDVVLQKEATNQVAKADLVVNGTIIGTDIPATYLLGLETKLKNLRKVYDSIPTLAPGIKWEEDFQHSANVYKASHTQVRNKTRRVTRHQILVQPTEHHPAQIDKWDDIETVGHIKEDVWSGMVSPARKSELLSNIDNLIQAVKKARQRANTASIVNVRIGKEIFDFIHA